jgi:hypothetical protein
MRLGPSLLPLLVLSFTVAAGSVDAWAAPTPTEAELRRARARFVEGERAEDADHWEAALAAFREVADVKSTAGVRYHIALCEEHVGKLVAALSDYEEAKEQARSEKNAADVPRLVDKQVAALGPLIPRLVIRLTPDVAGARVTVDDSSDAAPLLKDILVDPGAHRLVATAPGRPPVTESVTLQKGETKTVELRLAEPPPPAPQAVAPASAPPTGLQTPPPPASAPAPLSSPSPPAQADAHTGGHAGAIVATVAAAVLAGGGVAAFLVAGGAHNDGVATCAQSTDAGSCDAQKNTVRAWDWVAAGSWAGAAVTATIAVVLWTRGPSSPSSSASLVAGPASIGVRGSF